MALINRIFTVLAKITNYQSLLTLFMQCVMYKIVYFLLYYHKIYSVELGLLSNNTNKVRQLLSNFVNERKN
jgi:hypothetical protein